MTSGDPGRPRRLHLPPEVPEDRALLRILELAGWTPVRTADGEGLSAVWQVAPSGPGQVGLSPLRMADPDRIAGLRITSDGPPASGGLAAPLEDLLAERAVDDAALLARARGAVERLRGAGFGTSPWPGHPVAPPEPGYVLVLDEPKGAVRRDDIRELIFLAREENPGARIVGWALPGEQGHLGAEDIRGGISLVGGAAPVWDMLEGATAVYTVASPLGFDAIFAGHKPNVFGQPYYAGRGLTEDRGPVTRFRRPLTRAQLFAASMIMHPFWYDPNADRLCGIEDAIASEARLGRRAHRRSGPFRNVLDMVPRLLGRQRR